MAPPTAPLAAASSHWQECSGSGGTLIDSSWITSNIEIEILRARYILVVEKECVYSRLIDDGVIDLAGGIIVITGKGYPDLSTRACLKALHKTFNLPVRCLCDCNPHGISILLTYKIGSSRMPESKRFVVPALQWLGLRPSQLQRIDIPDEAFQP